MSLLVWLNAMILLIQHHGLQPNAWRFDACAKINKNARICHVKNWHSPWRCRVIEFYRLLLFDKKTRDWNGTLKRIACITLLPFWMQYSSLSPHLSVSVCVCESFPLISCSLCDCFSVLMCSHHFHYFFSKHFRRRYDLYEYREPQPLHIVYSSALCACALIHSPHSLT